MTDTGNTGGRASGKRKAGETEDSILEALGFLRSNWKLLSALTLAFSLVAFALQPLVIPPSYSKTLALSVVQAPSELLSGLDLSTNLDSTRAGRQAEEYLEQGRFGPVNVNPRYDTETEMIEARMRSEDEVALGNATRTVVEALEGGFQEEYEETLGLAIRSRQARLEADVENNRELLGQIDSQLQGAADPEVLGTQRAVASLEIEQARLEQSDLEDAQRDLTRLADEPVAIEVASESRTQSSSSLSTRVTFALLVGVLAAAVATVLLNLLRGR